MPIKSLSFAAALSLSAALLLGGCKSSTPPAQPVQPAQIPSSNGTQAQTAPPGVVISGRYDQIVAECQGIKLDPSKKEEDKVIYNAMADDVFNNSIAQCKAKRTAAAPPPPADDRKTTPPPPVLNAQAPTIPLPVRVVINNACAGLPGTHWSKFGGPSGGCVPDRQH